MKKVLAIIMTICLMASMLCITASAAETDTTNEPAEGVVMRVSAQKKDGTIDIIGDYTSFEEGWDVALHYSCDNWDRGRHGYVRSIVDFYADWHADDEGNLTSWYDYLGRVPVYSESHMTINLNGHTIDRGLTEWQYNGEVMYVDFDADLIINDGTITGGYSCNGAGGIHINRGANVVLNNVNVVGNTVEDDDGAAIAVYDGATLTMNGGSISNNTLWRSFWSFATPYGALYLNDSTAYLNDVVFEGNVFGGNDYAYGVAIYADDSDLVAENCTFKNNGYKDPSNKILTPNSIITIDEGTMEFNNCVFENNGTPGNTIGPDVITVFGGANVKINNSKFLNNVSRYTIFGIYGTVEVTESHFEGNLGSIFYGQKYAEGIFTNCKFVGAPTNTEYKSFYLEKGCEVELNDCELGDSTFNDVSRVNIVDSTRAKRFGSMLGEGSLAMIVSLLALVASVTSIVITASGKKKGQKPLADTDSEE